MKHNHAPTRFTGIYRVLTALALVVGLSGVPLAAHSAPTPDPTASAAKASADPPPTASDEPTASDVADDGPTSDPRAAEPGTSDPGPEPTSPSTTKSKAELPATTTPATGRRAFAVAQVPPASPTTAVITVKTGGDRTSQDVVGPLAGVTLQLYNGTTAPTTAVADAFATCISDADGDCSFIVPDVGTGGANFDRRFWIVQTGAPAGWRINASLRTGEAFGAASQATRYTFRTGEQLRAGETYTSGRQFMRGTGSERDVSGGIWQSSRDNPALPNRCGLRVGLVIDLSASVGSTGGLDNLKNASQRFVDSLVGTRSSVALFTFSSLAPATGANNANLPATSVSTQDGADTVKARIEGLTAAGHTNWDRGLYQAAPSPTTFDLVAILTDGNPSVYGNDVGPAGFSRIREVESGIFSANAIKKEGTRVVAFGVGTGIDDLPNNLAAISGPVGDRDYYQTDTYEEAGAVLRALALGDCDSTVTVIKQVVPNTAPPGSIEDAQPAGGWEFTADGGPVTSNPTTGVTAPTSGALNFDLRFPGGTGDSPVTFTETQQAGFTLQPVGGSNAVCSNVISGADLPVTDVADGFTVTASRDDAITCTVYNRAAVPVASLMVDKTWNIDGEQFANGTQPADFRAALTVTDQPDAVFGTELTNYLAGDQPTINETTDVSARPGCLLTSSRVVEANGVAVDTALPYTPALEAGANVYQVENVVTCRTELTMVKQVEGGDADPDAWLLSAIEPPDALAFASGTSGVTHPITPDVRYALAESGGDPNYQQFVDPNADLVAGSTGSFRCIETAADRVTELPGFATGLNGYVDARPGTYVQCAAVNQTASLTLIKQVTNNNGGTAIPADFDLTATPVGDPPEGVVAQTVTGSDTGTEVSVRPGVRNDLSESALDGYTRATPSRRPR